VEGAVVVGMTGTTVVSLEQRRSRGGCGGGEGDGGVGHGGGGPRGEPRRWGAVVARRGEGRSSIAGAAVATLRPQGTGTWGSRGGTRSVVRQGHGVGKIYAQALAWVDRTVREGVGRSHAIARGANVGFLIE
jgi:hypothetical protein